MKKSVDAKICWVSYEEGGRKNTVPIGIKYSPLIFFDGQETSSIAWSAEIFVLEHIGDLSSIIKLSYLSPEAPRLCLESGNHFKLYEGAKIVASGEIT